MLTYLLMPPLLTRRLLLSLKDTVSAPQAAMKGSES